MYRDGAVRGAICIEDRYHVILLEPSSGMCFKVLCLGNAMTIKRFNVGEFYLNKQKFYEPMFLTNVLFDIEDE